MLERLRSNYYRGRESFFGDLTQIVTASEIYNGEEEELTVKAKSLIEKLKKELKQTLDARPKPKTPPREDIKQTRAQTRQKATVPVTENSTPEGVELTFKAMVRQNHNVKVMKDDDEDISLMIDQRAIADEIRAASIEEQPSSVRVGTKRTAAQVASAKLV